IRDELFLGVRVAVGSGVVDIPEPTKQTNRTISQSLGYRQRLLAMNYGICPIRARSSVVGSAIKKSHIWPRM
ncbi:epoxide hydrolase, partial [Colletotrichum scovillei]